MKTRILLSSGLFLSLAACGEGSRDSDLKLSGGQATQDYRATLVYKMPGGSRCTGTKVSDRFVLTAAHCVAQANGQVRPNLGANAKIELSNFPERDAADTRLWHSGRVSQVHIYHQYLTDCARPGIDCRKALSLSFLPAPDLALIEFKADLPAQWPAASVGRNYIWDGDSVAIVGYGCENGLFSKPSSKVRKKVGLVDVMNGANINTPDVAVSESNLPDFDARFFLTPGAHFGMESSIDGSSLCPGDSGGPVYRSGSDVVVGVHADYTFYDQTDGYTWSNIHTRLVDPWGNVDLLPWLEDRLPASSFVP